MRLQVTYFVDSNAPQRDGLDNILKARCPETDVEVCDGSTICNFDHIVCLVEDLSPTTKGGKTLDKLLMEIRDTIVEFGHESPSVVVLVRSTQFKTMVSSAPKKKEEADA